MAEAPSHQRGKSRALAQSPRPHRFQKPKRIVLLQRRTQKSPQTCLVAFGRSLKKGLRGRRKIAVGARQEGRVAAKVGAHGAAPGVVARAKRNGTATVTTGTQIGEKMTRGARETGAKAKGASGAEVLGEDVGKLEIVGKSGRMNLLRRWCVQRTAKNAVGTS